MDQVDEKFYSRADAHISLSNEQLSDASRGKVCASMMYSTARFTAWLSAFNWKDGAEMKSNKQQTLDFFIAEYTKMLEEHLDDYSENFEKYMKPKDQ